MIIVRPFKFKLIQILNTVTEAIICGLFLEILLMKCKSDVLSEDTFNFIFIILLAACLGFQYAISIMIVIIHLIETCKKYLNHRKSIETTTARVIN